MSLKEREKKSGGEGEKKEKEGGSRKRGEGKGMESRGGKEGRREGRGEDRRGGTEKGRRRDLSQMCSAEALFDTDWFQNRQ